MFSRNPSRSVTGAEEPAESAEVLEVLVEPDEPHPAASAVTAATPAAISALLIVRPLFIVLLFPIVIVGLVGYSVYTTALAVTHVLGQPERTCAGSVRELVSSRAAQPPASPESSKSIPDTEG